jgi:hypothetical protein
VLYNICDLFLNKGPHYEELVHEFHFMLSLYRMSQENRSIFWEIIVSVILTKKMYIYMCSILNHFRDRGILLYSCKTVDKKEILHTVSNIKVKISLL